MNIDFNLKIQKKYEFINKYENLKEKSSILV